jgi:uncharacterized membrane protein
MTLLKKISLKNIAWSGAHWLLASTAASALLLRADFLRFMLWWAVLLAVGLIFLPMTRAVFGRFKSKGYIFSKVIGTALAGYVSWVLASARILPFRSWALLVPLLAGAAVNYLVIGARGRRSLADGIEIAVRHEALFMLMLAIWSYVRGIGPDIIGLEKFMDFGLMNSMLRSDYFPPPDMWYAGQPVNYYYLGQYFAAYLTKLSGISSAVSYNLMMASLFALAFTQAFNIGQFLLETFALRRASDGVLRARPMSRAGTVCGLLTGALVCLSGNLHTVIYAWLSPGGASYWYPNATRYIGYNPLVETDGTIHEFPHYSFIVSDLHAHVINLIFVLTVVAAAVAAVHLASARREAPPPAAGPPAARASVASRLLDDIMPSPGFALIIFLIGLFPAANFWDFPIYITVTAALYLYSNIIRFGAAPRALAVTAAQTVITGLAAYAVALPFHLTFVSISTDIALVHTRSRLYQLLVLYGYQAVFFAMLLVAAVKSRSAHSSRGEKKRGFVGFIDSLNPGDAAALIIFVCAVGLVILPELVYVVDIYTAHPRANTMFKLTFQAFVLFAIGVGYAFPRLFLTTTLADDGKKHAARKISAALAFSRRRRFAARVAAAALSAVLLGCAFIYPYYTLSGRYGSLSPNRYRGLDGSAFLRSHRERFDPEDHDSPYEYTLDDDYHIIKYINENIEGSPVIAEANGLSYTSYGRIAAFTGLPDIFNWYTHEQLWRLSDIAAFNERIYDLEAIYTGTDAAATRALLDKYDVEYIVIGKLERFKYGDRLNIQLLTDSFEHVMSYDRSMLLKVNAS